MFVQIRRPVLHSAYPHWLFGPALHQLGGHFGLRTDASVSASIQFVVLHEPPDDQNGDNPTPVIIWPHVIFVQNAETGQLFLHWGGDVLNAVNDEARDTLDDDARDDSDGTFVAHRASILVIGCRDHRHYPAVAATLDALLARIAAAPYVAAHTFRDRMGRAQCAFCGKLADRLVSRLDGHGRAVAPFCVSCQSEYERRIGNAEPHRN